MEGIEIGVVARKAAAIPHGINVGSILRSAVMDSLSLKLKADESLRSVIGSLQVSPPLVDLLTKIAEVMRFALADRLIW